jgi:phosphoenolpyruvate-protein phosphotransferase
MSRRLRGIGAAPGAAVAAAWIFRSVVTSDVDVVDLAEASARAADELERLASQLSKAGRGDEAGILDAQALMAADPELLGDAQQRVASGERASVAIVASGEAVAATLEALDDAVLSARGADVRDVAARIARVIRGEAAPRLDRRSIVVAVDLPPSVTAELDPSLLAGIALQAGSPTAHAAILSRALGIPAVLGVSGLLDAIGGSELLGVDGTTGEVIIAPEPEEVAAIERAAAAGTAQATADAALREQPLAMADGHRLMLGANIGRPEEADAAVAAGAEGVGLFRTEFMFMGRSTAPSEAVQAEAYAAALRTFGKRPVVIRLLDVGGDKALPYLGLEREDNPFLGVRAIRIAERDPDLLLTQLRAILRAARATGVPPHVMAPMVADMGDVALVQRLLQQAMGDVTGAPPAVLGVMIEIPAAVLVARELAGAVDFFSIGTNDLTQYLLAADRTNPALAGRQDPMHPAVLRAIGSVVESGRLAGIPVAVCGEMAGDPAGAVVLAGLGVDELSMEPRAFGAVKRALAGVTLAAAQALAERAVATSSAAESRAIVGAEIGIEARYPTL